MRMSQRSVLRQDLNLHAAEPDPDGAPAWILHDPLADRYYRLGWIEVQILGFLDAGTPEAVAAAVSRQIGRPVSSGEIQVFLEFLGRHHLLRARGENSLKLFLKQAALMRAGRLKRLARQYLFLRFPLWRPDRFLVRTLPLVRWVFHPITLGTVVFLGVAGIFWALRQADLFLATALDFLSVDGALVYAVVISAVKILHELGHAYTARMRGCRVSTIGVVILVFWPVLYTDVSEAWKLPARRDRLAIGAAGMLVELGLACIALFLWGVLPAGTPRDMAFVLATASWLTTLGINLNPLMRFDGYYLLADYWRVPNLQTRALALVRWQAVRWFLGLDDPPPDEHPARHLFVYGWCVVAYRTVLVVSISLLIYHLFFKLLALMLIALLWGQSFGGPMVKAIRFLWQRRADLKPNKAMARTLLLLACVAILFWAPWPRTVKAPAVLQPPAHAVLYAPFDGRVGQVHVAAGTRVTRGQVLAELAAPDLAFENQMVQQQIDILRWQMKVRGFDTDLLGRILILETEMRTHLDRLKALEARLEKGILRAPMDAVVSEMVPGFKPGTWIGEDEALMHLVDDRTWHVVAYVNEAELGRLPAGGRGRFYPHHGGREPLPLDLISVEETALKEFDTLYPTGAFGGPIPVRQTATDALVPLSAVYRVYLRPSADLGPIPERVLTGTVVVEGRRQSLSVRFWRSVVGVLRRESGF